MQRRFFMPTFLSLLAIALLPFAARAQAPLEAPDVVVEVEGMSCPFCAYGIEKKLKKVEGVERLAVHLEAGKVEITLKEGARVSEERLREAVVKAGFEARTITFVNERARAAAPPRGR